MTRINDIIADKCIPETVFECSICQKEIHFHIMNRESYVSATERKNFGLTLTTYRVYHDLKNERHYNAVLVDQDGAYRGHVDSYREQITHNEELEKKTDKSSIKNETKEKLYKGVAPLDIILEREKNAFILDKTVLNTILKDGPLSLEELRLRTLDLETSIGIEINIKLIETICEKYVLQGLIQKIVE